MSHLKIQTKNNIIQLGGLIPKQDTQFSNSNLSMEYLLGQLSDPLKPRYQHRFVTESGLIEIRPNGMIIGLGNSPQFILNGIQLCLEEGNPLKLLNNWSSVPPPFKVPSYFKQGSTIYLSGIMTGGWSNQMFTILPPYARPNKKLTFYVNDACLDLLPTGEGFVYSQNVIREPLKQWYSLDGIHFETDNHIQPAMIKNISRNSHAVQENFEDSVSETKSFVSEPPISHQRISQANYLKSIKPLQLKIKQLEQQEQSSRQGISDLEQQSLQFKQELKLLQATEQQLNTQLQQLRLNCPKTPTCAPPSCETYLQTKLAGPTGQTEIHNILYNNPKLNIKLHPHFNQLVANKDVKACPK